MGTRSQQRGRPSRSWVAVLCLWLAVLALALGALGVVAGEREGEGAFAEAAVEEEGAASKQDAPRRAIFETPYLCR